MGEAPDTICRFDSAVCKYDQCRYQLYPETGPVRSLAKDLSSIYLNWPLDPLAAIRRILADAGFFGGPGYLKSLS